MFEAIKRSAAKLFVLLLFSVLLLSFALWGIPNYSRDGSNVTIAKIGDAEIAAEEFQTALTQRRQVLSRQLQTNLTPEQARAFGLDQRVLSELVSSAAIGEHARLLGMRLPDAYIADQVRTNPLFQGANKTFSRAVFDERLRQVGLTERQYFRDVREGTLREELTGLLSDGLQPSPVLLDILHKYQDEQRTLAYVTLDPAKTPKPKAPDEAKLKEFFERIKTQFKAPETRQIAVLVLNREAIKARVKVTDAEVEEFWKKDTTAWDVPERRRFQIVIFKTRPEAEAAAKEVAAGKSLFLIALEVMGAQGRLDQGPAARREIGDPKLAGAVFGLPLEKVSEPIELRNGFALVRLSGIEPGRTRPLAEVTKDIRQRLEETRLSELEKQLHEQIDDRRGSRMPLSKIAEELQLKVVEVASIDKAGNGPDAKPALTLPETPRLVASAFEGDKNAVREPITFKAGGEAWVDVVEVKPERQKTLDEVKADVTAIWIDREHRTAVAAAAEAIVARLKKGETLAAVAKGTGLKVATLTPFKRTQPPKDLTPSAARVAFALPSGGAAVAETPDAKSRMILVVTEIKPAADATKEETEKLAKALKEQMQSDMMASYITALRDKLGFTFNEAVYRRVVGLERQ